MSVPLVHPECESDSSEVSVLALSSVSSPGTELSSLGTKSVAFLVLHGAPGLHLRVLSSSS